jgi:hypothetical protein
VVPFPRTGPLSPHWNGSTRYQPNLVLFRRPRLPRSGGSTLARLDLLVRPRPGIAPRIETAHLETAIGWAVLEGSGSCGPGYCQCWQWKAIGMFSLSRLPKVAVLPVVCRGVVPVVLLCKVGILRRYFLAL